MLFEIRIKALLSSKKRDTADLLLMLFILEICFCVKIARWEAILSEKYLASGVDFAKNLYLLLLKKYAASVDSK